MSLWLLAIFRLIEWAGSITSTGYDVSCIVVLRLDTAKFGLYDFVAQVIYCMLVPYLGGYGLTCIDGLMSWRVCGR